MKWSAARTLLLPFLFIFAGTLSCRQAEEPPPEAPRAIRWVRVSEGLASQQRTLAGAISAIDETKLGFQVSLSRPF